MNKLLVFLHGVIVNVSFYIFISIKPFEIHAYKTNISCNRGK